MKRQITALGLAESLILIMTIVAAISVFSASGNERRNLAMIAVVGAAILIGGHIQDRRKR